MDKPQPCPPHPVVKKILIAAIGVAVCLLLLSAALLVAGQWWLGGIFGFLGLTALGYDVYAAMRYRQRRQLTTL